MVYVYCLISLMFISFNTLQPDAGGKPSSYISLTPVAPSALGKVVPGCAALVHRIIGLFTSVTSQLFMLLFYSSL